MTKVNLQIKRFVNALWVLSHLMTHFYNNKISSKTL